MKAEIQYAEGPGIDWDSKEAASLVLGAQLAASSTTAAKDLAGFAFHQHLGTFVDSILRAEKTCGGLLWFGESSQDTTLSPAMKYVRHSRNTCSLRSVAWVLWQYSALSRPGDNAKVRHRAHCAKHLALSQLDYATGRNPEGLVYARTVATAVTDLAGRWRQQSIAQAPAVGHGLRAATRRRHRHRSQQARPLRRSRRWSELARRMLGQAQQLAAD